MRYKILRCPNCKMQLYEKDMGKKCPNCNEWQYEHMAVKYIEAELESEVKK